MTGVVISDDVELIWAAGDVETAGTVILYAVGGRWAGAGEIKHSGVLRGELK